MRFVAILVGLLLFAGVASGAGGIVILVDGEQIETDVPAQIIEGRTMVPIRFVAEELGAEVDWNDGEITVDTWIPARKVAEEYGLLAAGNGWVYDGDDKVLNWKKAGKKVDGIIYLPAGFIRGYIQ